MPVQLNHTIVPARDPEASARFLTEIMGLPDPVHGAPFWAVELANGVTLDYVRSGGQVGGHYAFLITEEEFDEIYGRVVERGLDHWADPQATRPGEINTNDGGRGVYFQDPDGAYLEIITRPYGSGGA